MPVPAIAIAAGKQILTQGLKTLISAILGKAVGAVSEAANSNNYQMRITVKNATQFDHTYFDSGRYVDGQGLQSIEAFQQLTYEVCNRNNSGGGVTGGNAFKLILDDDTSFDFAIGWCCPVIGSYKAQIIEGTSPYEAYSQSTSSGNGNVLSRHVYTGEDEQGNTVGIRFRLESTPGQCPIYKIVQEVIGANTWQ